MYKDTIDAEVYVEILQRCDGIKAASLTEKLRINTALHPTQFTTAELHKHSLCFPDQPDCNPDLSPAEYV